MKVAIVGAGIIGQLLAFSLKIAGWNVTVLDYKKGDSCSDAAAGLLSPYMELEKNDLLIYKLGIEALNQHWPSILNSLNDSIYFQNKGSLMLAHSLDHVDLIRKIKQISYKLNTDNFYHKLDSIQLGELEPEISKFQQGYYFPSEGQIDSQGLLRSLRVDLIKQGVTWLQDSFVSEVHPGKIILNNIAHSFDLVCDCRGLGAKTVFDELRSVRGELLWLSAPDVKISRPLHFVHPRYNLYLVPRPHHEYLVGASEIETEDYSPISLRTTLELLTAVYSFNSKFSEARIIKTVTQCRPTLTDHLPRIKYTDGVISVNGLYRHGFLIAPSLVYDIMRWVKNGISKIQYAEIWEKFL